MTISKSNVEPLMWPGTVRRRPGMYIPQTQKYFAENLRRIVGIVSTKYSTDSCIIEIINDTRLKITFDNLQNAISDDWVISNFPKEDNGSELELFALNALCQFFKVEFLDSDTTIIHRQVFKIGKIQEGKVLNQEIAAKKVSIEFELDETIWDDFKISQNYLLHEIREFAYLYSTVKFEVKYQIENEVIKTIHCFKNGLADRLEVEKINGIGATFFDTHIIAQIEDFEIEVAYAFREYSVDEPFLKSYVNEYYTHEDGTHIDGLLKGLTYGTMKYFQKHQLTDKYKISEKGIKENLIAIINIKMKNPSYGGCVRNRLTSSEVIDPIANYIAADLFQKIEQDEKATQQLIRKFEIWENKYA